MARQRLEHDQANATRPAGNRTYQFYLAVKACAEPITVFHLALDTGRPPLQECVLTAPWPT